MWIYHRISFCIEPPCYGGQWPGKRQQPVHPDRNYEEYTQEPYQNHQQYVHDIFDLTLKYADQMKKTNGRGKTLKQILINGSAYSHFRYLQNGNMAVFSLTQEQRVLFSFGTAANEALHAQFNTSQRTVVQQHAESTQVVLQSFTMAKLLAHHSAAFGITVAQRSQGQIQALLQGYLLLPSSSFCLPFGNEDLEMVRSRRVLRRPVHAHNAAAATSYVQRAAIHRERWVRHLRQKPRRKKGCVKRTIFTKKKQRRLRRGDR